jgi:hypothetical protein
MVAIIYIFLHLHLKAVVFSCHKFSTSSSYVVVVVVVVVFFV